MIVAIILCLSVLTSSAEVDNLNILLPQLQKKPHTMPLQLISTQDGCYYWSSSMTETISVASYQEKASGCSRQALVSVGKVGSYSSTIYIEARDSKSQSEFKIPVRLRQLTKINIFTKSRMMNIRQIQKLQIFGFDAEQNTFTSLEGLRFKWSLQQSYHIIEQVPLHNAHLFLPLKTRENLEQSGYQSDMIVVKALSPGNLKVTARCIEPGYQHITDEITISVHQRFELIPGPVIRMAPQTGLQLSLVKPSSQKINLPQQYYQIKACEGFNVNSTLYLTTPNSLSRCTIKVSDKRTKPPFESSVEIIVQNPDQLRIKTEPLVIVNKESPFQIQLMKGGEILYGQSEKVKISSQFNILPGKKVIIAKSKKSAILTASLGNLKKEVHITSLLPVKVVLPDDYLHLPVGQTFQLKILGGTGLYDFQLNHQIATVTSINHLNARSVGDISVIVRDRNHLSNTYLFRLKVSPFSEISSLQAEKELNKNEWGDLYMIGRSPSHQTFTQCKSIKFSLSVPSFSLEIDRKLNQQQSISFLRFHDSELVQKAIYPNSILKNRFTEIIQVYSQYVQEKQIESSDLKNYVFNMENYGICKTIRFKSIVSFEEDILISAEGEEDIKAKVPLRVYNMLTTTIEGDNTSFIMTPQSSLQWSFAGGSYKWPNSETNYLLNNLRIKGTPLIKCGDYEKTLETYHLKIQNNQTKRLLFPVSQVTTISVICKFPKKVHLKLQDGEAFEMLYIESETIVKGSVQVRDEFNLPFYNSSNVYYQFGSKTGKITGKQNKFSYQSNKVQDTLLFYSEKLKSNLLFARVYIEIIITIADPIQVVHPLSTNQKNLTILALYTPKKPYLVEIHDLHSQVFVQCSKAISCEKGDNTIVVKFLKIGTGNLLIRDRKIYGSKEWNIQFIIVEMDEIRVKGDRNFVQEGEIFSIEVENYYKGSLISPYTYEPSYLQLSLNRNLRVIEQRINKFLVKAQSEGEYQIEGENTYPSYKKSKPFELTVYTKISTNVQEIQTKQSDGFLQIEARTSILLGCKKRIKILGGPKSFSISHETSSSEIFINSLGKRILQVYSQNEGKYSLTLKMKFRDQQIAKIIIKLTISKIQSIQLQSINEPVQGSHFRIHPKFRVGNSNLEQSICDFQYQWKVQNHRVSVRESMSFGFIDGSSVNATALKSGQQIITLQVFQKQSKTVIGSTSKTIQVLQEIDLAFPTYIDRNIPCQLTSIIMPPFTKYSFDSSINVKTENGVVILGEKQNTIESGQRLGHSTISLYRSGSRVQSVEVEVKNVEGLFIGNSEGYISIEANSAKDVDIYLQDNNGRLFISPLENLDISVVSSNQDIVEVKMSPQKKTITIQSKGNGVCIISLLMPSRNIIDSIVVSVGNALNPGKLVSVLVGGTVQFSSSSAKDQWSSSNKEIASIDEKSGLLKAHRKGTTKVNNGELSSVVQVFEVQKVIQVKKQKYVGASIQAQFMILRKGNKGLEELTHFGKRGDIDNHLSPRCSSSSRYLTAQTQLFQENGVQRVRCIINAGQSTLPGEVGILLLDEENKLGEFNYKVKPIFTLDKRQFLLSPTHKKITIKIQTLNPLNITTKDGHKHWIQSKFNEELKEQHVEIDMRGQENQITWHLEVSCDRQSEVIKIIYSKDNEGKESSSGSFWSSEFDWTDYLIAIMAIVFFGLITIQHFSDEKIKNS